MEQVKPNCQKCYYGGLLIKSKGKVAPNSGLYSCRRHWNDGCKCEHFIPCLSEKNGDIKIQEMNTYIALQKVSIYKTKFKCPFCGNTIHATMKDIPSKIIRCKYCSKQIKVSKF